MPGKPNIERLPNEVLQEIFLLVPAVQIPSLRLLNRRIACCIELHYRWNLKALRITKECRMLVGDWLDDIADISMADLKEALIRTDNLQESWRNAFSSQIKPASIWRRPDCDTYLDVMSLLFSASGFLLCQTECQRYQLWDQRNNTLLAVTGEPDQVATFLMTPFRAPFTIYAMSFNVLVDFQRVILYEITFPSPGKSTAAFTELSVHDISLDVASIPSLFIFPRVINLDERCMVFSSTLDEETLFLCVLFGDMSRYCVVDTGVILPEESEPEFIHPPGSGLVIVRVCCPDSYSQCAFPLDRIYAHSKRIKQDRPINFQKATYTYRSAKRIKVPYSYGWPACCRTPVPWSRISNTIEMIQDWPVYCPKSAPFRTSTVHVIETTENDATDTESPQPSFYLVQFYCSADGPLTKHRFVHKLTSPLLGNVSEEESKPIVGASFDHFCWVEKTYDRSVKERPRKLAVRLLTFPRKYDADGKVIDPDDPHHEEPTICTLDVPEDVLLSCISLTIAVDAGGVLVETRGHTLHTFYYA